MSQHLGAPTQTPCHLRFCAIALGLVLSACATVAGFEDFSGKGTGGSLANVGGNDSGGGFVINGGSSNNGDATGGIATGGPTGGAATGGLQGTGGSSVAPCGAVGQKCCALTPSCSTGSCCFNGNCIAVGSSCGSSTSTCQASGHCSNCGQVGQACCSSSWCEFGNECSGTSCRACGTSGLSCCDNPGFPACNSASVCVSANGTYQNVCASTCGAGNQACCSGGSYTGSGCEVGATLTCSAGICRAP